MIYLSISICHVKHLEMHQSELGKSTGTILDLRDKKYCKNIQTIFELSLASYNDY